MLTVIFGAGASYDSEPITARLDFDGAQYEREQFRPPLTNELFDPNRVWFKQPPQNTVTTVLSRIRRGVQNGTLEETLEQLKTEVDAYPDRWRNLVGVQDWLVRILTDISKEWLTQLRNETCYVDLVDRLLRWQFETSSPINVITFNYDTLFESAVRTVTDKARYGDFSHYMGKDIRLFKPHGSVDWQYIWTPTDGRKTAAQAPLNERDKGKMDLRKLSSSKKGNQVVMPAIAIPVTNKAEEDFVLTREHRTAMYGALQETSAILIIGWAGAEQHFMSKLKEYRTDPEIPVLLVCGSKDQAENARYNVAKLGGLTRARDSEMGFAEFLHQDSVLEEWLDTIPKS